MSSLYLGLIGTKSSNVELHAFTSGLPFREYPASAISDLSLFKKMIRGRYELFEQGRSIYCTAVNPDIDNRTEINPHDTREGTIHVVSVDSKGEIASAVSVAVDTTEKDGGSKVGLPLENRWKPQDYPEGQDLDPFRKKYPLSQWNRPEGLQAWEMAECYRHYKAIGASNNISCRLGLYTASYQLLVREARKKNLTPTRLLVFDAIPKYFNLYKLAGCAALRDLTIQKEARWLAPGPKSLRSEKNEEGSLDLLYKGMKVSRNVLVPVVKVKDQKPVFTRELVPFLDGVVDLTKLEQLGETNPYLLMIRGIEGFTFSDRIKLLFGLNVIGRTYIRKEGRGNRKIRNWINDFACKQLQAEVWDFKEPGR